MNKADSRRLEEIFISKGYKTADMVWDADVVVFNTCSVREHAENKALSNIGSLKVLKDKNPAVRICVVGCMAQRMQKEIRTSLPHVDFVVGPSKMFELPILIERNEKGIHPDTEETVKVFYEYLPDIIDNKREYSGYVPIMKGCGNFCSYCIVPYVRGREQYRPKEEVLAECAVLAKTGINEIMLLGQTVNSHPDFKSILRETAAIKGIKRVRFVTSYPGKVDRELVDIVRDTPALCNYFHIPVQSGSDDVLKRMNRDYTTDYFMDIAMYIRKQIPAAAISSDFIAGFPGETDRDFEKTLDIVKKVRFDQSFTFKYSPRPMTRAYEWEDDVPLEVKKERLARLNEACSDAAQERNALLVGKKVEILSEGGNSGRTGEYKIVFWEGDPAEPGAEVEVDIKKALPHSLTGRRA
ncbi:MAG: tRNA (N6-isopentenyl adenosine(37)-C2)-methylthiotransferase MiaB [Elusimicrobia bacterium]|nr:tRNA (N6-isopentenyl adenosine(37)-C2)-methylthiotransferase MiaB [Elusimicrobiota bacterium]